MSNIRILIIAHAPLASALKAIGQHIYTECTEQLTSLDISVEEDVKTSTQKALEILNSHAKNEWLILTDVFGATPCNIAKSLNQLAPHIVMHIVSGVNVPMLWSVLCYSHESLIALTEKALAGGAQGIIPVEIRKTQQQAFKVNHHDQSHRQNQ